MPTKWEFRAYILCDKINYTFNFDLCQEIEFFENFKKNIYCPVNINWTTEGHIFYTDSYYTSVKLAYFLKSIGLDLWVL